MAGGKKTREKAQELRKEIQTKAKMTREELSSSLLRDIREEQLDAGPKDSLSTKTRISRLSTIGAAKELEKTERIGLVKMTEVVGQRPPRWERLLGADLTTEDWNLALKDVSGLVDKPMSVSSLRFLNEPNVRREFLGRCYEDEDTMKLIFEAYERGIKDTQAESTKQEGVAPLIQAKKVIESQRKVIEFLLKDHEEELNPVISITPRELVDRITLYFIECDLTKRFYTVPGLAFYIGFPTREDFLDYVQTKSDSVNVFILKRALTYIESETVTDMMYGGGLMTGHKINLATNFNYADTGRKGEQKEQPGVTINNNVLSMTGVPPKPESIEEWQAWYIKDQNAKLSGKTVEAPVIDTPLNSKPVVEFIGELMSSEPMPGD